MKLFESDIKNKKKEEKIELLSDKNLPVESLEILSKDRTKDVKEKVVNHQNVTQDILYKMVQLKSNQYKNLFHLIFDKLSPQNKFKIISEKKWEDWKVHINDINNLQNRVWKGIENSSIKKDMTDFCIDNFDSEIGFIESWLLKQTDITKHPKIFDFYLSKKPNTLLQYRKFQNFDEKAIDKIFRLYVDKKKKQNTYIFLSSEIGSIFLSEITGEQITVLFEAIPCSRFFHEDLYSISTNQNITPEHTETLVNGDYDEVVSQLKYTILKYYPLYEELEKFLKKYVEDSDSMLACNKELTAWIQNDTHSKKMIMDILTNWNVDRGWDMGLSPTLLSSSKYNDDDIDEILEGKPYYYKKQTYEMLIKQDKFSESKVTEIWNELWSQWKKEIIKPYGSTYSGDSFPRELEGQELYINSNLYYILTKSTYSEKFAFEYFKVTNDESYFKKDVKEIFLF